MKHFRDQVWAYLHDELSIEERRLFERALDEDEVLRQSVAESRTLHQDLAELGNQNLVEHLLEEWEVEHPEYREPGKPAGRRTIRFALPLTAAAAAVLLLLSLPLHQGPVHWQKTIYGSGPQLRGELGTSLVFSRDDLSELSRVLQDAVETRIDALPTEPGPWKLRIRMQELANGYLGLEVSGYPRAEPDRLKTWDETFDGSEPVDASLQQFAERIVADMAERNAP